MEKSLLANIKAIIFHYRYRFFKAFFMVLISNILLIFNPLIFRQALISLDPLSPPSTGLTADILNVLFKERLTSLWQWAALLLAISLVSAYFKYWMRMGFLTISREVETEVRAKLFARIQSQSRSFFDRHGVGELLSRLTNDISAYRDLLGPGLMYPQFFITIIIPGYIALFSISAPLATLSLVPLIVIPLTNEAVRHHIYRTAHAVQASLSKMSNMAQEHYSGIRIIKSYVIENRTLNLFREQCRHFFKINFKLSILQGFLYGFTLPTRIITVALVLLSGYIILKGWGELTPADFISFMWIQSYIFFPILMLSWILPIYERGSAAYARLLDIYNEPIEVQDNPNSALQIPPKADIHFNHLTFSYPGATRPALSDLNLHITGGTFVGITGPIGAGKSTLFHIINREYEIPPNALFIGGHEIHEYSLDALRADMVTVEQAAFLFTRSVADNVRFGREEASLEELEMVSRYADLHDTVMDFPEQYDTVVGERGVTLSGGQKQRVAMARAFLVNRSILLLDDIFSAVDTGTEKRIFDAIRAHFSGRTVLLITHRVSILEQMDRIIYMIHGSIKEDGSPSELLAKNGAYAALTELQRTDRINEEAANG